MDKQAADYYHDNNENPSFSIKVEYEERLNAGEKLVIKELLQETAFRESLSHQLNRSVEQQKHDSKMSWQQQ
jgi:hypothetical protein